MHCWLLTTWNYAPTIRIGETDLQKGAIMRSFILGLLLVVLQGSNVHAQTTEDEAFISFRETQLQDFETLETLNSLSNSILEKYKDISHAGAYERSVLELNKEAALEIVTRMHDRGKTMFDLVEQNYNRFCLQRLAGPLPCDAFMLTYRVMIADTLMLGATYSKSFKIRTILSSEK